MSEELSNTPAQCNDEACQPRAQLDHVLFDVDFHHKPTVKAFRAKFGWVAIPWLFEMYALMSRATNARVDPSVALLTASDMGLKDGQKMIDHCVANGLFDIEFGLLTSRRVANDQESLYKKQERWRKAKGKSEDSASQPRGSSADEARKSEDTEQLNTEVLNVLDPKEDGPPRSEPNHSVHRWAAYLKRKWNRDLDEIQRETLILNWASRPSHELIDGINNSIANNYKSIVYKPPDDKPPSKFKSKTEQFQDEMKRISEL